MMSISSPQRRLIRRLIEQQLEILDARGGAGLEGARGNGVHSYAPRSELIGQIPAGSLQRRLHRTHHIVVGHYLASPQITHGEHSAALGHERRREPRHPNEGMTGDIHRLCEALGGAVEEAALQIVFRGKGDGMHQQIEAPPFPPDYRKPKLSSADIADFELAPQFERSRPHRTDPVYAARVCSNPRKFSIRVGVSLHEIGARLLRHILCLRNPSAAARGLDCIARLEPTPRGPVCRSKRRWKSSASRGPVSIAGALFTRPAVWRHWKINRPGHRASRTAFPTKSGRRSCSLRLTSRNIRRAS